MRKDRAKRMKIKISKEKLQRVLNDHHDSMSGLSKKLKAMLENGRMNAMTIQTKAEMEGITLANLTKAKQELGVKTDMTGSGRNQKVFWYL